MFLNFGDELIDISNKKYENKASIRSKDIVEDQVEPEEHIMAPTSDHFFVDYTRSKNILYIVAVALLLVIMFLILVKIL